MNLINEIEVVVKEINSELPDNVIIAIDRFEDVLDEIRGIYTHLKTVLLLIDRRKFKESSMVILCDANTSKNQIEHMIKSGLAKYLLG